VERKLRITVNGTRYDVTVEDVSEAESRTIPGPGDMRMAGSAVSAPAAAAATSAAATSAAAPEAAGPGDEVCPLAGVVEAIAVSVGQSVNEGDKLATLEAMKMKTHVFAHRSGKITNIAAKVGDSVDAGQVLFTIGS